MGIVNDPDGACERLCFELGSNHFDLLKPIQRIIFFDIVFDTVRSESNPARNPIRTLRMQWSKYLSIGPSMFQVELVNVPVWICNSFQWMVNLVNLVNGSGEPRKRTNIFVCPNSHKNTWPFDQVLKFLCT